MTITLEMVRSVLSYDQETGIFTWLKTLSNRRIAGMEAGGQNHAGYVRLSLFGRTIMAHRVAYLLMTGKWPTQQIDHRDLQKNNNRWSNLRLSSHSQNGMNRSTRADNKSGHKGVWFNSRTDHWAAFINRDGKRIHLGNFAEKDQAITARQLAASKVHEQFARF